MFQVVKDKHIQVMKVANEAEDTLNSIKGRRDELEKNTNWSQPAAIHSDIIIAQVW